MAVEPLVDFREAGQRLYPSAAIEWRDDALPQLPTLIKDAPQFDFILASGIWHHLNPAEQAEALANISKLLLPQGSFALSLRNGPAGAGTHVFPTNVQQTINDAKMYDLHPVLRLENQASLIRNKKEVYWAKLVFSKK